MESGKFRLFKSEYANFITRFWRGKGLEIRRWEWIAQPSCASYPFPQVALVLNIERRLLLWSPSPLNFCIIIRGDTQGGATEASEQLWNGGQLGMPVVEPPPPHPPHSFTLCVMCETILTMTESVFEDSMWKLCMVTGQWIQIGWICSTESTGILPSHNCVVK